jgi:hypothetical protein
VVLFSIFFLGVSATLVSTVSTISYHTPNPCFPGSFDAGFPYPWYVQPIPSPIVALCYDCFHCRPYRLLDPDLTVRIFYFLVDTVFYAACFATIMMTYNATIQVSRRLKTTLLPRQKARLSSQSAPGATHCLLSMAEPGWEERSPSIPGRCLSGSQAEPK